MDQLQPERPRLSSLDQFRGYTVLGMFLVNFVGHFNLMPPILKHHHTYCSYADTIMPHFLFAVGFAYRLTFLRRLERESAWAAYGKAIRRNLGLILLGVVWYHIDDGLHKWAELSTSSLVDLLKRAFLREAFQTLVHIGVTCLWVLPVICCRPSLLVLFAVLSAAAHVALSWDFYFDWVWKFPGIDGGPLGFLTWTIPLVAGALANDVMRMIGPGRAVRALVCWGILLMAAAYLVSCLTLVVQPETYKDRSMAGYLVEPPFVPPPTDPETRQLVGRSVNMWMMSQRAGSISYLMFGAGLSLALFAGFVVACDWAGLKLGIFRTFGSNALAGYLIHEVVANALKPWCPRDSELWYAWTAFGIFLTITYLFVHHLEKHRIYLRL